MNINGLKNCSEEDILRTLDEVENEDEEFAILEQDDSNFIQTCDGELEYHNDDMHFRVADAPIAPEKIKAAFLSYYREDGEYLKKFHWELVEEFSVGHESLWSIIIGLFRKK